jgi:hypothetical protein
MTIPKLIIPDSIFKPGESPILTSQEVKNNLFKDTTNPTIREIVTKKWIDPVAKGKIPRYKNLFELIYTEYSVELKKQLLDYCNIDNYARLSREMSACRRHSQASIDQGLIYLDSGRPFEINSVRPLDKVNVCVREVVVSFVDWANGRPIKFTFDLENKNTKKENQKRDNIPE